MRGPEEMQRLVGVGRFGAARGQAGGQAGGFAWPFALAALALVCSSAVLVGLMPLQLSVATVFLFAGPHNRVEFRYFVSRMPVRRGRPRAFFGVALTYLLAAELFAPAAECLLFRLT